MSDRKSDDCLPEGWKVQVKVRANGRKDKCYIPPSGGVKFYSKLEVSRYLNNCHPKSVEKEKDNDHQSSKTVLVEKTIPDGLPPGWVKEVKVTQRGNRIRRDPYYIDPVSGYVFRSMKDALRYIESGDVGRLALKPKDKGCNDVELEDDKTCSPVVSKEQKLGINGTSRPITRDQSSKLCEVAKDQQILHAETIKDEQILNLASTGECVTVSDHPFNQCGAGTESSSSELPENKGSDQRKGKDESAGDKGSQQTEWNNESAGDKGSGQTKGKTESTDDKGLDQIEGNNESAEDKGSQPMEGKNESTEDTGSEQTEKKCESDRSMLDMDPSVGIPNKGLLENGRVKDVIEKPGPSKTKKRKELNLPRRASKRLAGIPLDPAPELKTTNRARRAAVKQCNEIIASTSEHFSSDQLDNELEANNTVETSKSTTMLLESNKNKHPIGNANHAEKVETEMEVDEKHGRDVPSSMGNPAIIEHAGTVKTDKNAYEKPGLPIDTSLVELWQDPCIAFAIKTLTGMPFDDSESLKVLPGSNNSEFGGLATLEAHARKDDIRNGSDKRQGCTVVLPLGNLGIPEQHAGEVETSNKADEKPGSPLDMPFADAWSDPCIEFAIKTLTGAIPLDYDMAIQDYLPQQVSSSQQQESSGLTLPNVGEFCQTELLCQQFGSSEKPLFNQSTLLEPALPHTKNVNLGYSGGTSQHRHSKERSKECGR